MQQETSDNVSYVSLVSICSFTRTHTMLYTLYSIHPLQKETYPPSMNRILILQRFSIFKHVLQDQSFYYSKQSNTSLVKEFLSHIYFFHKNL